MNFSIDFKQENNKVVIKLTGELDASVAGEFKEKIEAAAKAEAKILELDMTNLDYMSSAGLRVLIFAKQKMGVDVKVDILRPQEMVLETINKAGLNHSFSIIE